MSPSRGSEFGGVAEAWSRRLREFWPLRAWWSTRGSVVGSIEWSNERSELHGVNGVRILLTEVVDLATVAG